ncbi:TPA: DUF2635 domain-containing protein [Klebsiella oxytoca]|uniref:DUF2635 domain-containing protein n=1 Tax=Klebsiella oxytoca TaxID=571 RepID=A0AAN5REW9_KLEOX|nr:DUF2635 domain-containing protein [Klebsiella oxytoca]
MFVKPVSGRKVRCPVRGTFLPENGADVPDDIFWRRRLNDGDVVVVVVAVPDKAPTATGSKPAVVADGTAKTEGSSA